MNHGHRRSLPAAAVLALTLPLLTGCAHSARFSPAQAADSAASPSLATPHPAPVVRSFRSTRTRDIVARPVRVRIPSLRIVSALESLRRARDGTVEVPSRGNVAGWYADGNRPGERGPAVILGHVDTRTGPAIFFHLEEMRPGDLVFIDRQDSSTVRFRVTAVTRYHKSRFPSELVYLPTLEPSLRLVTCGGRIDPATGHYRDNVIVLASQA